MFVSKRKLRFLADHISRVSEWVIEWLTEYAIFLSSGGGDRNEIWHKGSLGVRMMTERRKHAWRRESARYHTSRWKLKTRRNMTCVLVTAHCNQSVSLRTSVTTSHVTYNNNSGNKKWVNYDKDKIDLSTQFQILKYSLTRQYMYLLNIVSILILRYFVNIVSMSYRNWKSDIEASLAAWLPVWLLHGSWKNWPWA